MLVPRHAPGWRSRARVGRAGPAFFLLFLAVLAVAFLHYRRAAPGEREEAPAPGTAAEVSPATPAAGFHRGGETGGPVAPAARQVRGSDGSGAARAATAGPAGPAPGGRAPTAPSRLKAPVAGPVVTGVGWAYSKTMGDWRWHAGVDVAAPPGTPVRAAAGGRVRLVRDSREWGWEVVVEHGGGMATRYAGCRSVRVREGEAVAAGQVLAEVGDGGLEEVEGGPHLHFEVLLDGNPVDPRPYLR